MSTKQEPTKPLTRMTHEVELSSIRDNAKPVRAINDAAVASLAKSFGLVGQLAPIVLTTDRVVVFGRQRIAAQRARGETTIMATFVDLPDILTRVATLDENLVRLELTALQQAELFNERKALYEQLHPGSQHGAALKGEVTARGFTRAMSALTGRGRSTIAEDVVIGRMPESVRSLIRGTPLEHRKGTLLELARLPDEAVQLRTCRALLDGSAESVTEAQRESAQGSGPDDVGDECGSAGIEGEEGADGTTASEVSVTALVDSALESLEDWLTEAATSPEAENRYVASAVALSNYAVALLERVASGIEATGETSGYARRVRRSARVLAQRAQRMTDELMLVTECTCSDGCSSCGFARGFAAFDLADDGAQGNGEP